MTKCVPIWISVAAFTILMCNVLYLWRLPHTMTLRSYHTALDDGALLVRAAKLQRRLAVVTVVHDSPVFIHQLNRFLYPSWHYSRLVSEQNETSAANTSKVDLIVLMYPEAVHKAPAECILVRAQYDPVHRPYGDEIGQGKSILQQITQKQDAYASQCFVIEHYNFGEDNSTFWDETRNSYMHSITFMTQRRYRDLLLAYDFVLRSDVDSFIAPKLFTWKPPSEDVKLLAGWGSYVHLNHTSERLQNISRTLGFRHQGIHNIGTAWLGRPEVMIELGHLAVSVAKHILLHECEPYYSQEWSRWWCEVTSLYASEIAINELLHLPDEFVNLEDAMDAHSDRNYNLETVLHIHCWHVSTVFDKFSVQLYNKESFPEDSIDKTKANQYALWIYVHHSQSIA
eukprot:TRINITY_DN12775_c0_g1_i2.p1 TRINITY_DN12775_c0_g1~~TRINITY_DN12775_c0_g1_i2.p1  ORF type:complete len:398 (-),score=71.14 TRINITY_DN12775_c0_g1_i2:27-1220(-)